MELTVDRRLIDEGTPPRSVNKKKPENLQISTRTRNNIEHKTIRTAVTRRLCPARTRAPLDFVPTTGCTPAPPGWSLWRPRPATRRAPRQPRQQHNSHHSPSSKEALRYSTTTLRLGIMMGAASPIDEPHTAMGSFMRVVSNGAVSLGVIAGVGYTGLAALVYLFQRRVTPLPRILGKSFDC